jgi:ABC-type antimicrobial peptide transport system permease subunit
MMLTLAFGGLALFLSAIGIYGVLAYLVAQRRREIGIRVALGSTGAGIVRLVLREGMLLVAIGLAAGLAGAVALQNAVANQVYGVRPLDPLVLGSVAALLGIIALVACVAPARRAVGLDPVRVLAEQ